MIGTSPVKQSLILHISRPVRDLISKFSLILLFIIAVSGIYISKNESDVSVSIRTYVLDVTYPVISFLSKPVVFIGDVNKSIKSYFFLQKKK